MSSKVDKKHLKIEFLVPKEKLRAARRAKELKTCEVAEIIGISREQYEKKEAGKYPFQDYEMMVISNYFEQPVTSLFF
ncbi:XRE family transcriptional regulator [Enterococcus sp.]|uniref:helix-turn-helix transcriptional regulator n=1 Tax=Enterococcus sp. TaxID=35783 RepID=UPI0028AB0C3C|nr:XRE family transcriptional regulator [Enterococcus sp.]